MAPKVPVVTTSTARAAPAGPFSRRMSIISSAVTTTTLPFRIFSLISAIVLPMNLPAMSVRNAPNRASGAAGVHLALLLHLVLLPQHLPLHLDLAGLADGQIGDLAA